MTTCLYCGHEDDGGFLFCPRCGTKAPEQGKSDTLIGRTLSGKYRIVGEIGSGAMGTVYVAEHVGLKKKVALKVLLPDLRLSEEQLQRFQREGIAAGKFNHPNAIQIFDFDKDGATIYLAMEWVEGSNLHEYLDRKQRLDVPTAMRMARQIVSCLAEAHRNGIVHRDLKPDNVMVVPGSRGDVRVKVLDFGLSKLVALRGDGQSTLVTQQGRIMGTPRYMAPEQCAGSEVDARSDLYAVGLMLYEMVAGKRPFEGEDTSDILFKRANQDAPSLLADHPELDAPHVLDRLITRALQRRPRDRFQTAEELLAAIEAIPLDRAAWGSGRTTIVTSRPAKQPTPSSPRPARGLVLGGAVALVLGIAAFQFLVGGAGLAAAPPVRVRDVPAEERNAAQDHYVRLLDLARTALRSGNASGARTTLGDALQSEQVDSEAFLLLAETFRALSDDDSALASYGDAIEEDPDYADAYLGMGWLHLGRGRVSDAGEAFTRAAELAPDDADARAALGVFHYRSGDEREAGEAFRDALARDPKCFQALLHQGRLLLDEGDAAGAAESLVEAKLAEPSALAHAWLGEAYLALDRARDAEIQWRAGLDVEDSAALRADLGSLLLAQERYTEAETFLAESARRFGRDAELAVLYGTALFGSGNNGAAIRALEDARRLGADDAESMTLLGLLYHAADRLGEAQGVYEEVRRDHGEVPRANLGLGMLQLERGDSMSARDSFLRVTEFDDTNAAAHLHLGLLEMEYFGDPAAARTHLDRYLELGGQDPRVRSWLEDLGG